MKKICIFGSGGHAKVIFDIALNTENFTVEAFFSQDKQLTELFGVPVFEESEFPKKIHEFHGGVIAIGDNFTRATVFSKVQKKHPEFKFVSLVHPSAILGKNVAIGAGTVVMPNSTINVDTKIGDHVIVNTAANIDHDCRLDDFSSVGPGASLGGTVKLGISSSIGLGANVNHMTSIGAHTVVGSGSVVVSDLPENSLCYGTPCKAIRSRDENEKYL